MAQPIPFMLQHSKISQISSLGYESDFTNKNLYGLKLLRLQKLFIVFFWYFKKFWLYVYHKQFIKTYYNAKSSLFLKKKNFLPKLRLKFNTKRGYKNFLPVWVFLKIKRKRNRVYKKYFLHKQGIFLSKCWNMFNFKRKRISYFNKTYLIMTSLRYLQVRGWGLIFFYLSKLKGRKSNRTRYRLHKLKLALLKNRLSKVRGKLASVWKNIFFNKFVSKKKRNGIIWYILILNYHIRWLIVIILILIKS